MKTLWKASVSISQKTYEAAAPALYLGRVFGVFPLTISKLGQKVNVEWSIWYAFYSLLLGASLIFLTFRGLLEDILGTREQAIKIKSDTDMYVVIFDATTVHLVMFVGICVGALRFSKFFEFFRCINETERIQEHMWLALVMCALGRSNLDCLDVKPSFIDSIITLTDVKATRRTAIFRMLILLTTSATISTADLLMYFRTRERSSGTFKVLRCYSVQYITYLVVMMIQYRFWHFGNCILRRLKELNKNLEIHNHRRRRVTKKSLKNKFCAIFNSRLAVDAEVIKGFRSDTINNKARMVLPNINHFERPKHPLLVYNNRILRLALVYVKLCDAAGFVNQMLGVSLAITIVDTLWHFVETPYHLLSELIGPRRDPAFLTMMVTWCFFHSSRLLIIIEPCNSCKLEVERTRKLVCKLLYSGIIRQELKSQLKVFFTVLHHCKLGFSAGGLAQIDRTLITGLLGTATTYVVILIQQNSNSTS